MKGISFSRTGARESSIERAAANWLGLLDGDASPAQQSEFQVWLQRDPRHAEGFERMRATSLTLDGLRAFCPAIGDKPNPNLPLLPSGRGLVRPFPRRGLQWSLAALAMAAGLVIAYTKLQPDSAGAFQDNVETAIGGREQMNLPDGSSIDLNTDSAVQVAYSKAERRVELLRGEAHFSVAKDAVRPFRVRVGGVTVSAVGTAFNVRVFAGAVEVLVTEGKVGVQDSAGHGSLLPETGSPAGRVLAAGQRAMVPAPQGLPRAAPHPTTIALVAPVEVMQRLAWKDRRLDFGPTPLQDVVAEFNRYSPHRLVIDDPELATLSVGGSFRAGDGDALVRLLESNFSVQAERRGNETLLRRQR